MKHPLAILCLVSGTPAWATGAPACDLAGAPAVPVIRGLPYDQARASLLASGWLPGHGSQFSDMAGNQAIFHERGYTELGSCDFGQGNACHFQFAGKGGVVLKVTTSGEENPLLDAKAVVDGAQLACED
jgi:hypothetical protein